MQINYFNPEMYSKLDSRDIMEFMKQLLEDTILNSSRYPDIKIIIGYPSIRECKDVTTMVNVTITFKVYSAENKFGDEVWEWKSYRAKNFSCSNNTLNRIKIYSSTETNCWGLEIQK